VSEQHPEKDRASSTSRLSAGPPVQRGFDLMLTRLIRVVGLGIAIFETGWEHADRPFLLLLAAAMMIGSIGLEVLLRRGWAQ
jgi:hypothetical protein